MTSASEQLQVLAEYDVGMDADCAECLPSTDGHWIAIGSYKLDEAKQRRVGQVQLYRLDASRKHLNLLDTKSDIPGVFELQWRSSSERDQTLLGCAAADGCFYTFPLNKQSAKIQAPSKFWTSEEAEAKGGEGEDETYCLSCDWSPWTSDTQEQVAVSRSDGRLSVLDLSTARVSREWLAHSYPYLDRPAEVWYTAYSKWTRNLLYSGADDAVLTCWDLNASTPARRMKCKEHTAGVCTIKFSHLREHLFVTGSYDNAIRLWDERKLSSPLACLPDLHGGVWRISWHPQDPFTLVAACMRGGFTVLRCKTEFEVVSAYSDGHTPGEWEALGYGVDWICPHSKQQDSSTLDNICGVSFYDQKLRLFSINLESHIGTHNDAS